jgi:hypothetical protein
VKTFVAFVAIGSVFATVEEFLTIVVLRRDVPSYLFTLIALFPAYLSFVYLSGRIVDRIVRRAPTRDLAQFLAYGSLGLLLEWSLMGLSPWSNPAANPFLMLAFQLGMFAFWGTVATAPRAFLDRRGPGRDARRRILRFSIPYFAFVYVVALSVPEPLRFASIIPLVVVGYWVVSGLLLGWVAELYSQDARAWPGEAGQVTSRPGTASDCD